MSHTAKTPPVAKGSNGLPVNAVDGRQAYDTDKSQYLVSVSNDWQDVGGGFGTPTVVYDDGAAVGNTDQIQGDIPANWKSGDTSLEGLVIGTSCTNIGSDAFYFCTNLKNSLVIPDSVTTIGSFAFYAGTGLTSLTIGSNVTSIGNSTFGNCSSITSISILATTAPTIDNNSFFGLTSLSPAVIHVPSGATGYDASYRGYTVVYDL